jgi:hypothetical protein
MSHSNGMPTTRLAESSLEAHELTFEQFASLATVTSLLNHGRRWQVKIPSGFWSFADGATVQEALREAHSVSINNALYFNTQDAPDLGQKPRIPPATVLAQYPDVVARFPELGLGTSNTPSQATANQLSIAL